MRFFSFDSDKWRSGGGNAGGGETIDVDQLQAAKLLRNGLRWRLILLGLILLAVFVCTQCLVITRPDQYMVVQQFGEIKSVVTRPGVSFKLPFIQTVRPVPNNLRIYDIPISDVITQDKKTMVADSFVLWRVADPVRFIRTLSGSLSGAESRIENISYNSMKNVISRLPQSEIISGRDTLATKIFDNVGDTLSQYGVDLVGIETKHLDLPDDNKQAVYARMISERNNIAASYQAEGEEEARKIRTETDTSVSILLSQANARAAETTAEGERLYMELLAQAYNDPSKAEFYAFVRALDAAKVSLSGGGTTLILSKESPLAQIFYELD
ncbi:MAG: protease modulator HflC [Peptococcaceae bacterium]|jgi:membrane protease subunit HflC|nr:protease modulator HflC [Peptococcaceae bacterium]